MAPREYLLTLLCPVTRRLIMQKARRHPDYSQRLTPGLRLLVSIWFQILFHSPQWGSFHFSLTVLVRYRSEEIFSLIPWSGEIPTGLLEPHGTREHISGRPADFRLQDFHLLRSPISTAFN